MIVTMVMIVVMVLAWSMLVNHAWRCPVWQRLRPIQIHDSPLATGMWISVHAGGAPRDRGTFERNVAAWRSCFAVNSWR